MKALLVFMFTWSVACSAQSLQITSFTASGTIEWTSSYTDGVVQVESICDLMNGSGWSEVCQLTVSGRTCTATIPLCDTEAYYRLAYYKPTQVALLNSQRLILRRALPVSNVSYNAQIQATMVATASEVAASSQTQTNLIGAQIEPVETVVVIKAPSREDFLQLQDSRLRIIQYWNLLYPTPLVFTNPPGSQADLIDMARALEKLSGHFYREVPMQ